jgi:hypothetical protein
MKIRDLLHRLWAVGLLSVLLHAQYCVAVATALHAVLVHRYSFDNNTLSDSIGGPSFDATLLEGASVGSSVSVFTGADNDNKEYGMLIGPGLINTLPDLTIEVWYKSLYEDVVGAVASSSERLLCFDYVSVGREPALGRLMVEYSPLGHLSAASTSGSILNLTAPMDQPLTDIADEAGDRLARAAADDEDEEDPTFARRRAKIDAFAATVNAAKRTNFDITDIHAVTDKHGVHPSVWAGRDANMDDFVVKQDGEGHFDKVIRTRDLGTLVVSFQQIWRQCNEWLV